LANGKLGADATLQWTTEDDARTRDIRHALNQMQDLIQRIANALEKPVRSGWTMLAYYGGPP
jgi:hypothetical protein